MGKFPAAVLFAVIAAGQAPDPPDPKTDTSEAASSKSDKYDENHILGIVPNYTTVNNPPKQ